MTLLTDSSSSGKKQQDSILATLYEWKQTHVLKDNRQPHEIDRSALHVNQLAILDNLNRYNVLVCGRRFGKTHLARVYLEHVVSSGQKWWYGAVTRANTNDTWRWLMRTFRHRADIKKSDREIFLPNGGYVRVVSLQEYDNLRGTGLDGIMVDEASFVDYAAWNEVLDPMLLENKGGAWFMSSPKGRNWFFDLYRHGLDPAMSEWTSFQFTAFDNPMIDRVELEAVKARKPERTWREEYLAEFLDDGGSVFRKVRENATIRPQSRVYDDSHVYVMGVDWARDNDYTVIAVIDVTTSEMVDIDRFNQINWNLQRSRIEAMAARWRPDSILAEANSIGAPNIEELQASGLAVRAFMTTAKSKPVLIDKLAAALENNELSLLDDEYLVNELMAYTMERLPGGSYRYNAPAGQHDDTVIATALAWKAASGMAWVTEFT